MLDFIKDPGAYLDYTEDWSAWLGTDTIVSSTWRSTPGIILGTMTNSTTTATIWARGGTIGEKYFLTNRIITAGGRQDERTVTITIRRK